MADQTRILTNGKFFTVDAKNPWAQAIVIKGKTIEYVGTTEGALEYKDDNATVEDLDQKLVTPGLIDGHLHAVMSIVFRCLIRIAPTSELDEMKQTIKEYVDAHPDLPAYMGMGWRDDYFGEEGPNKAVLDEISPDKPMALLSASGHCGWCNSKALEMAEVNADTPDPVPDAGHVYVRDAAGNPTGYFKESACVNKILAAAPYIDEESLNDAAIDFGKECASLGLTSLVDCGNYDFAEYLMSDVLYDAVDVPECPVRLDHCGMIGNNENIEEAFKEVVRLHGKFHSDNLSSTFLKILNDGTLENFSAAVPGLYPGDAEVKPTMNADELFHWGEKAAKAGLDLNVHAIGSLTVHEVLEAAKRLREAGYNDLRIICSHSAYVFEDDIEKFGKYDVIGNTTAKWFADTPEEAEDFVKSLAQAKSYPIKSILDSGAKISLSSDYPTDMTTFIPVLNIEIGLTRQPKGEVDGHIAQPEERLTLEEIIEGYTLSNAYQMRMEDKLGSIEAGKLADLTIFDQNLFEIEPHTIHDVKIAETIKDGVTRYKL